ncbi:ABC transporter permease [Frateuria defendens]|uniref:ABC transporter permease n=1 Tax=Frateuria defendens TaxID=2219559 RepID=UPI00066FD88B|nr:FtsX-like permease family protein [Frateuria defendens]
MSKWLQIRPILAALRSHCTAVTLLVLEIALTMAILGNLVFIVYGGVRRAQVPTGVLEAQLGVIQSIGVIGFDNTGTVGGDLAALRAVPGVQEAAYGGPPLWGADQSPVFTDASRRETAARVYEFLGSQGLSRTLGLRIVQGRDFTEDDPPDVSRWGKVTQMPVLITRALAERLYRDADPVGRLFYDGTMGLRVIGVVDHLRGEITGRAEDDYAVVYEYRVGAQDMGGAFMIRAEPGRLPQTLRAAAEALQKANPGHVEQKVFTMAEQRADYFRGDLSVGRMLIAIMLILLVVTALGVSGLASFWVQQRRRQIGVRRALGATRGDILRYFQTENFLIVSGGVLLGAVFAYALNLFLMQRFELARLPPGYLLVGAAVLWALGQLAVLGPALRAAKVPPVVATRSV